ncbi:hypothetical protein Aperf_G00000101112 [Anoplocephala perfoliata]
MSSADLPEPPTDPQRLAVIDKLAQFVARNGPDFEHMTMEKQYGNPDFSFLFGGEFSDYYKRKVEEFKMSMPQQNQHPTDTMPHPSPYHLDSMPPHPQWSGQPYNQGWDECGDNWNNPSWQHPPSRGNWGPNWGPQNGPPAPWCNGPYPANFYPPFPPHQQPQPPELTEEDVKHSEANLKAQYDKIIGEEQPQAIRQCLDRARMEAFTNLAASLSVNPDDVSSAIQPIIELCTKENIARGKNFAVETMAKSDEHANLLADYLLLRVQASEATFEARLHILYLINDLLHYLKRHSDTASFLPALNRVIVPIYSLALESADDEKKDKLTRVLNLWESNAYLSGDILKNMKEEEDRKSFMDSWRTEQDQLYADKVSQVESEHKARYESLKKQHDDFAEHVRKILAASTEVEQQQLPDPGCPRQAFPEFGRYGPPPPQGYNGPGWGPGNGVGGPNFDGPPQWHGPPPPHFMPGPPPPMSERWRRDMPPSYHPDDDYYDTRRGGPLPPQMPYRGGPPRDRFRRDGRFDEPYFEERSYRGRRRFDGGDSFNESAGNSRCGEDDLVQENRPPAVKDEDFVPTVPFWQLPAALMHPLIGAKDFEFKPLDPSKLRLLPPKPPSEQLMQALDAYYSQPSHDRPRDPEGWERLGLYEFYRSKKEAKEGNEVVKRSSSKSSSSSSNKNDDQSEGLPQLAYLTAYPKSAIGQAIRTGPAALIGVPPPDLLLPKMNAQFAAAAAAAAAINNSEMLKQPPPTPSMMSQPPPGMIPPQPQSQPPSSSNTQPSRPTRFTSALVPPRRRSRSPSRSYSGSRSRSRSRSDSRSSRSRSRSSSRSRSRSQSRSSGSRSRSSPLDRRYRDRSRSPRSSDGSITTAGFMRRNAGGGDQRNARRGGMGNNYPPPQQWGYDHPLPPPPPMVPPYDRRGGPPPGQMYPPYRGGGVGFRGNGYNASSPPPQSQPMGNGHRGGGGGPYYGGGGNSYGNPNRRGGAGCLHGQLDQLYADIEMMDREVGQKTELVLCCGDFQAVRNPADLRSLSVPMKYYEMGDFYRYYSEEVAAPILTVFVGGNHEASNYLQELPYGGWVAPNIWYMGYAGVVQFGGLRIGGLSGIYKYHDYSLGHFEHPPYSEATKRSVYHIRNLEVFRLGQVSRRLDIMLSHDWPRGIYHYGDTQKLLSRKRHFRAEVNNNTMGSPPAEQLLCQLKPRYWFAAHMHCKFAAVVQHESPSDQQTKFLALDKCLPFHDYLQFLDIDPDPQPSCFDEEGRIVGGDGDKAPIIISNTSTKGQERGGEKASGDKEEEGEESGESKVKLYIDPEWLCILQSTNAFLSLTKIPTILPDRDENLKESYSATAEALKSIFEIFGGIFSLPHNFERTAPIYEPGDKVLKSQQLAMLSQAGASQQKCTFVSNPQTELLCAMLDLTNPNAVLLGQESYNISEITNRLKARDTDDDDDEDEDEDESDTGPSLPKSARIVPNPEEIKLDDDEGYDPESVYVSEALPVDDNEYNPEPVVKNPEVIDIDDLDSDDDGEKDNGEDRKVFKDKEPEEYEPGGVDLEVTYSPRPVTEGNSMEENGSSKEVT